MARLEDKYTIGNYSIELNKPDYIPTYNIKRNLEITDIVVGTATRPSSMEENKFKPHGYFSFSTNDLRIIARLLYRINTDTGG